MERGSDLRTNNTVQKEAANMEAIFKNVQLSDSLWSEATKTERVVTAEEFETLMKFRNSDSMFSDVLAGTTAENVNTA